MAVKKVQVKGVLHPAPAENRQALLERTEGLCAASVERQLEGLSPSQRRAVLEGLIAALEGEG